MSNVLCAPYLPRYCIGLSLALQKGEQPIEAIADTQQSSNISLIVLDKNQTWSKLYIVQGWKTTETMKGHFLLYAGKQLLIIS